MNKRNYQKELEEIIAKLENRGSVLWDNEADRLVVAKPPRLLLHACCAPCSSYCLEYLCQYFEITVFYYNPNITFSEEYKKRVIEEKRLIAAFNEEKRGYPISIIEGDYEPEVFLEMSKGLEMCPEGGERCFKCFEQRLRKTAELMLTENRVREAHMQAPFEFYTTTLTISPLKNAEKINEIGERIGAELGVRWLPTDFKKKNGYKRSTELSAQYGLYRQDYCGCGFSKAERERCKEGFTAENGPM